MNKGRRDFIKQLTLAGFAVQFSSILSCTSTHEWPTITFSSSNLTAQDLFLVSKFHEVLFPNDGNGPSYIEINSIEHVLWSISISTIEETHFNEGLTAVKTLFAQSINADYRDVSSNEWDQFVSIVAQYPDTISWVKQNLTFILESLSMDPIYGINKNEMGWKWLEHQPGFPRPSNENKFQVS